MANYDSIIQAAAQRFNVDPALIRGVIATESNGNQNAQSGVGATGLMQIMPTNYKALGITDPKDPTQNIMGGTQLLSQLLDRFGDPVTALRHYHGGDDTSKWGPVNAAYPGKVLAAGGIQQMPQTLPGIPTAPASGAQSDDAIFSAFTKGAAPAQPQQQGPNDDQILAAFTKSAPATQAPAAQAAPAPASTDQPGSVMSFLAGLGRGVQETALGGQQLLGHGLQTMGANAAGNWLVNDANQGLQRGAQEVAPYQAAHPLATGAGTIGGSIAATAPLAAMAPVAGSYLGAAGVGAGLGAANAALSPVDQSSGNYWSDKAKQMGLGALTGGALAPVATFAGRMISPNVSPDVQALLDRGVTPTPGQILGGGFARTEDKLTSVPFLGDMIKSAQGRALGQFNQAAYNQALAPIGETFDSTTAKVGQEGIAQVKGKIQDVYNNVLPQMQFRVDPQFQSDVINLGQMAQSLPDAQQKTFMSVLKNQIFGKMGPQGNMDGQTLKGVSEELGDKAAGYMGDQSYDNRQLGAAISALKLSLMNGVKRSSPGDLAQQLDSADAAWANFARIRNAGASTGAGNAEGIFTPAQLQSAVRSGDKTAGKGAFATGNALMQDLSSAGQSVLGSKYPDSGTAGRGLLALLAPGGVAAGLATAPGSTLATLGGIGLGSLPYTGLGQRAVAAALTARPQFAQPVGNAIAQFGPRVVAGGLPALLSGSR
ncbi:transglycosylase-like protein with SLT domain [Paraburkholderia silvatlantica]|uniref:Transglycosylase-like protein with SLT domain n=1 Tax=Paraburkholderia silvatlantica TaxID=321895 RepID=A0A2V4TJB6_9BURK|nr:transglycosylase SLT domain-containing protein [Paraburkholderia silvatlantica]PYE21328.1 transglycosylase-like protein with SLT domain [Paraburkholderia silvatlantica]